MPRDVILTAEGLEELKQKIEHLSTERRREVAERIKAAREFGDIAENAEYDDAKNEQAMLEKQISDLEDKLRSATIVDAPASGDVVSPQWVSWSDDRGATWSTPVPVTAPHANTQDSQPMLRPDGTLDLTKHLAGSTEEAQFQQT